MSIPELRTQNFINPKVATKLTTEKLRANIPLDYIRANEEMYGILSKSSITNPVRHTKWDYLWFNDASIFSPAATAYKESIKQTKGTNLKASYCPYLKGTTAYKRFWKEEFRRCKEGYEPEVDGKPCGVRISGEYYFYLNYCVITLVEEDENGQHRDKETFPRFLQMDYYWFKELEARENPALYNLDMSYKKSMICAKARRKGFSYKAAAGAVWVVMFNKNAKVVIASETGEDAVRCFEKCLDVIDWLSEKTEFGMPKLNPSTNGGWTSPISRGHTKDKGSITVGRKNTKTGAKAGRRSEIYTVSLHNSPDKAAGAGTARVIFEEAGKCTDLKKAWGFTEPVLRSGEIYRGIGIIFGTGGDMGGSQKKGSSRDFSEMFYNPTAYGLCSFENIHERTDRKDSKCGWFVDDMWFREAPPININGVEYRTIDENGNANRWLAEIRLNMERIDKARGSQDDYNTFLTQYCKTPSEAFLVTQGNIFPTADLFARYSAVKTSRLGFEAYRTAGELIETAGVVQFKPDLDGKLKPIESLDQATGEEEREGCILQYESPKKVHGVCPPDAYIISVDPIGQNTESGKSLTSIIVMKTSKYHKLIGGEKIVMTYRGRSKTNPMGFVHQVLEKMSKYYNAKITYENDRGGGILQYFIRTNQLHRLISTPIFTMSKYIPNSKTLNREYGHSMASDKHKRIGEQILLEWLLTRQPPREIVNEKGEVERVSGLRNLDLLEDRALLEELIAYDRKGNYDVVMAMMGAVIQLNERFANNEAMMAEAETASSFWSQKWIELYGSTDEKRDLLYDMHKKGNIKTKESIHEDVDLGHTYSGSYKQM